MTNELSSDNYFHWVLEGLAILGLALTVLTCYELKEAWPWYFGLFCPQTKLNVLLHVNLKKTIIVH